MQKTLKYFFEWLAAGFLLIAITGCSDVGVKSYGVAYNSERAKLGLPPVPNGWKIYNYGQYFDCINEHADRSKPHRSGKRVSLGTNGVIAYEQDSFYSGQKFLDPHQQFTREQYISILYDYSASTNSSPWRILADLSPNRVQVSLTLQEADRILASWGLSRNK